MSRTFIDIVTNNTTTRKGEKNMSNIIFIHKEAGTKKDAVRVNRESDIKGNNKNCGWKTST